MTDMSHALTTARVPLGRPKIAWRSNCFRASRLRCRATGALGVLVPHCLWLTSAASIFARGSGSLAGGGGCVAVVPTDAATSSVAALQRLAHTQGSRRQRGEP